MYEKPACKLLPVIQRLIIFFLALMPFVMHEKAGGAELVDYSLCDVRVMYVYDDPARIEWPVLYYLNDSYGCRIDLVSVRTGVKFLKESFEIREKQLFLHNFYITTVDSLWLDTLVADLFAQRRPDIVIFGNIDKNDNYEKFKRYLLNLPVSEDLIFNILKIYQSASARIESLNPLGQVILNGKELLNQYRDRLDREVSFFFPWYRSDEFATEKLLRYNLLKKVIDNVAPEADFLSGIKLLRLVEIINRLPFSGPMKATFLSQSKKYITSFNISQRTTGKKKVEFILNGYRELLHLKRQPGLGAKMVTPLDYSYYLDDLVAKAEKSALDAVGISWDGKVVLRDSPHGPKLKFIASVSSNGPKEVFLSYVNFHPSWDTNVVTLDNEKKSINPHQSFEKEYLIDIEQKYFESSQPESLLFSAEIVYGQIPLEVYNSLPLWVAPKLAISFDPDFYFVQPVAKIDVDRIVSSMNWKVIITKPYNFSGKVNINLETPRGLFAGAYRQELSLDKGYTRETVRIPFTISNLFEQGIQKQAVSLSVDGRTVASGTGQVRVASCHIADTVKVGYLPDTTGLLEDVLRLTDAAYRPLTDRSLITADLDPYDVIVIGSGAFRRYPSLRDVRDRLLEYLRDGGSIVVFGQPDDWPEGVLPVALVPDKERVSLENIVTNIKEARILSQPYRIEQEAFLAYFEKSKDLNTAVISPAEKIFTTASGGTLLSVSRIGEGQVIYCGLPVLEMIANLELEAIHLFANILNY